MISFSFFLGLINFEVNDDLICLSIEFEKFEVNDLILISEMNGLILFLIEID